MTKLFIINIIMDDKNILILLHAHDYLSYNNIIHYSISSSKYQTNFSIVLLTIINYNLLFTKDCNNNSAS